VDHRKIKRLIEQRKTITDRQFFASRLLAGHFADVAAAQTRRYGYSRRVKARIVWEPKNGGLARTDNDLIWINAGHPMVTAKKSRVERYDMVCGLFAHELGHVLYTDFLAGQSYGLYFQSGRWYPEAPPLRNRDERMNEDDLWFICKADPKRMAAMARLAFSVGNILEDGYIESKILDRYPGVLGYSLEVMREAQFAGMPTLTRMIELEDDDSGHIWLTITQLMLSYVKFGELKYGEEPLSDERVRIIFALLPELDRALTDQSAKERWNIVNIILIRCWPHIKDFLDKCEERAKNADAAGDSEASADSIVSQILSALAGASEEASGNTTPVTENAGAPAKASAGAKRAATAAKAAQDETPSEDEDATESKDDDDIGDAAGDGAEAASETPLDSADSGFDGGSSEENSSQNVSTKEQGRIPLRQTDSLFEPMGGTVERDEDYRGSGYGGAVSDIERLLDSMAEKAVTTQLENQRCAELNDLARNISYGDIHSGVSVKIHRIADVEDEMKEQYREISPQLLHISKLLQRSVSQQLRDRRHGGKLTGLLMGRRLDAHALSRNDGRVFYKNALPNEIPELAVALLNDESGSMCSCDRATYARAASIILYDFCRALEIPVMVYGHSANTGVDLYSYAEFDAIDSDDCCRLMDISARNSNRDGAALRFVADRLSKRPEDVKILILISDGQPAAPGYSGTAAEEDLRGVKHEYSRKGILFIAAAIGDDKENIERIYGDGFLDIADLNKLPAALTNVIKRHIRV
jgi:cobalamin biosynthesis protein CobT